MMTTFLRLRQPRRIPFSAHEKYWLDDSHQHVVLYKARAFRIASLWQSEAELSPPLYVDEPARQCLLARFSLDLTLLALQRSRTVVEVVDHVSQREWVIDVTPKGAKAGEDDNSILPNGVIWSDHGGNSQDLVIVTERSVDFYKVSVKRGQCKLSRSLTHPGRTRHFWYHPEQRVLLLATGSDATDMRAYYLRWEVTDLPRFELPPPEKVPKFQLPVSPPSSSLDPRDVALVRVYGRMYAAHIDQAAAQLHLHALDKDQVCLAFSFMLYVPGAACLTVLDNLICVHNIEYKVTMLYDVMWLSWPEALQVANQANPPAEPFCGGSPVAFDAAAASAASMEGGSSAPPRSAEDFYNPQVFELCAPCWALDVQGDTVWAMGLHLPGISEANRQTAKLVPFLLRRGRTFAPRLPGAPKDSSPGMGEEARGVLLEKLRDYLLDGVPLREAAALLARVLRATARAPRPERRGRKAEEAEQQQQQGEEAGGAARTEGAGQRRVGPSSSSGPAAAVLRCPDGDLVISQEQLLEQVFAPLAHPPPPPPPQQSQPPSSASAAAGVDQAYLCAVLVQAIGLMLELGGALLPVDPQWPCLAITLMAQLGLCEEEMVPFLRYHEGLLDSPQLADVLLPLVLQRPHDLQLQQLCRDLLYRLGRQDSLLHLLLRTHHLPEALRALRQTMPRPTAGSARRATSQQQQPQQPPSPEMVSAITQAALARTRSLPLRSTSRRAATLYLLQDALKTVDPDLFLSNAAAGAASGTLQQKEKGGAGGAETRRGGTSSPERSRPRFTDIVPSSPFEGLVPETVSRTLAVQIFGYDKDNGGGQLR